MSLTVQNNTFLARSSTLVTLRFKPFFMDCSVWRETSSLLFFFSLKVQSYFWSTFLWHFQIFRYWYLILISIPSFCHSYLENTVYFYWPLFLLTHSCCLSWYSVCGEVQVGFSFFHLESLCSASYILLGIGFYSLPDRQHGLYFWLLAGYFYYMYIFFLCQSGGLYLL